MKAFLFVALVLKLSDGSIIPGYPPTSGDSYGGSTGYEEPSNYGDSGSSYDSQPSYSGSNGYESGESYSSGGSESYPDNGYSGEPSSYLEQPSSGGGDSFGSTDVTYKTKCTPRYEIKYEDKCLQYTERVCTTHQREQCHDVPGENCKAIVAAKQVRKCFDVTELLCSLKEDVQYEVIQATYTVQKCQKVTERVCDTVADVRFTNKDDYKCINVNKVYCYPEEKTLHDRTCKTVTHFDCNGIDNGGMDNGGHGGHGGHGGDDSYTANNAYSNDGYNGNSYNCKKSQENKCYNTPRQVTVERCEMRSEKACEKLNERIPYPTEKQHCHNEEKKVCELEQRTQPKQVKKYVYTKACRPITRNLCENMDVKDLVQSCAPHAHKNCNYSPIEKCEDVPKEHCYKVGRKIKKQSCEKIEYKTSPTFGETNTYQADVSY